MTSVVLAHPGITDFGRPRVFPPWGILSVASDLRAAGHDVTVLDLNGSDPEMALFRAVHETKASVVGLTAKSGQSLLRFRSAVEGLRSEFGDSVVIAAGGPLVGTYPNTKYPIWSDVNALFLGDGEEAMCKWLSHASFNHNTVILGPTESNSFREFDGALWWGGLREYIAPSEAWPNFGTSAIHMTAARGCTKRCTFCYTNQRGGGSRFREPDAGKLFQLLEEFSQRLDVRGFFFVDDCFIDKRRAFIKHFTRLNREAGQPFAFGLDAQLADLADEDLMNDLQAMGARTLYVGIECASPIVRRTLGKGTVRQSIKCLISKARDRGMIVRASIGIGWPRESLDDMKATLDLIDDIPSLAFDAYRYLPLPRTPMGDATYWHQREVQGTISEASRDYSDRNQNYSAVDDASFEWAWSQLRERERERLRDYMAGRFDVHS